MAATCCAASVATGRKQWFLKRTAFVVSTGVVWFSARNAWFEKNSVFVTDELMWKTVSTTWLIVLLEALAVVWIK